MRRFYILLCFCLLSLGCLQAQIQPPMVRWAVPISGCIRIDNMHVMPSGECYVIGIMLDTVCFDAAGLQCRHSIGKDKGRYNIFVAKYDPEGSFLWADLIGNRLTDNKWVEASCVDTDGNVYLSSYVSTAGMGDSLLVGDTVFATPQRQGSWLAKLSPTGKPLWVTQWQSPGYTMHLASHAESGVYITGYGSTSVQILNDSIPSVGKPRIYIAQLDGNGRIVRHMNIMTSHRTKMAIESPVTSKQIILTGSFRDSLVWEDRSFYYKFRGEGQNNFCISIDSGFRTRWAYHFYSSSITVYPAENNILYVYAELRYNENDNFWGETVYADSSQNKFLFYKLGVSGNIIWKRQSNQIYPYCKYCFRANKQFYNYIYYDSSYTYYNEGIYFFDTILNPLSPKYIGLMRADSNMQVAWSRSLYSIPYNQPLSYQTLFRPVVSDTSGRLYGYGHMNSLYDFIDNVKVQPLFYHNDEREHFIFGMTPDSFPPPPAPPYPPDWRFYPNPYSTPLHVSGEFQAGILSLRLLDLQGRELLHTHLPTQSGIQALPVRLPQLAAGVYILLLSQADKQLSAKLIVP